MLLALVLLLWLVLLLLLLLLLLSDRFWNSDEIQIFKWIFRILKIHLKI